MDVTLLKKSSPLDLNSYSLYCPLRSSRFMLTIHKIYMKLGTTQIERLNGVNSHEKNMQYLKTKKIMMKVAVAKTTTKIVKS